MGEGRGGGRRRVGRESSLCVWKCVRNLYKQSEGLQGENIIIFKESSLLHVAVICA